MRSAKELTEHLFLVIEKYVDEVFTEAQRQAFEETAKIADECDYPKAAPTSQEADSYDEMGVRIADVIRAEKEKIK